MGRLPAMPDDTFDFDKPFTRADLDAAGLELSMLRRAEFKRIYRGVWVRRSAIDTHTHIRAALALHGQDAIASHFSAGRLHGMPLPEHAFEHVMVFGADERRFRPGIKSHVARRRRAVVSIAGMQVSDLFATFVDLARYLSLVDLVVVGDWLVRRRGITAGQLIRKCRDSSEHHAGAALRAALFVREGVDSPMETRLRMLIVLAGLPEPEVNHVVVWDDGTWKRRYDLWYPTIGLIVEYDGRQHAADAGQWNSDLTRREEFDDAGLKILVVTAEGIFDEPLATLTRVRRNLILRGYGPVPQISEEWRQYFAA